MTFDDVTLDPAAAFEIDAGHAELTFGPGPVNFEPTGDGVYIQGEPTGSSTHSCADKFVPMPAH
jgi:hypothetical protein